MNNEETTTEETNNSRITELATKLKQLPWKKIAIGAAVTTVAAVAVTLAKNAAQPAYELEITESSPEGDLHVELTDTVND